MVQLTGYGAAKSDGAKQIISSVALCPAVFFGLAGLIGMHAVLPWNSAFISASDSMSFRLSTNQTMSKVWTIWDIDPASEENNDMTNGKQYVYT